ncbi:long-chain fatty acid--CoA ligase [Prauserella oleivorans]|uniref:Long-chain fatty acid--CoA ligase n=1 Tax=Prauserella oleivorans TaxID=1478153 RepID=A0ABW5W886_9PSEU
MRNNGIGSWPRRCARRNPGRAAIVHGDRTLTYREFAARVTRAANGLRKLGVGRGDRVAYVGANHPAFLEAFFAAGTLGAVFVPLNMRLAGREIAALAGDCGAAVLVHDTGRAAHAGEASAASGVRTLQVGTEPGEDEWNAFVDAGEDTAIDEDVSLDDPCLIMYTSGTTGMPKGAVLTHGNLTWNAMDVVVDVDLRSDEVSLVVAPLFHAAALSMNCLPIMLKGGTVVLVDAFDPERTLDIVQRYRITHLHGVPTIFEALTRPQRWPETDLSSVRRASSGGSAAPLTLIRTYLDRGIAFSQGYGMTETGPGALYLPPTRAADKVGAVGRPHFFVDVRVVDAEGRDVGPGEVGEVLVQGPNVMSGYWNRPDATEASFAGGKWFRSGDLATVDDDGDVSIVDRIKDMYISGGENVYPAEVEQILHGHPAVRDCAVIGVPDPTWGEVGRALIVPATAEPPSADDIIGYATERLAKFKVPKSVVFVSELPRNPSGKLLKNRLRDRYPLSATPTSTLGKDNS